jgi:hypothetical protein
VKPEEAIIADVSDSTFYVDICAKSPLHTGGMTIKACHAKIQHSSSCINAPSEDIVRLTLIGTQEEPLQEIPRLVIETGANVRPYGASGKPWTALQWQTMTGKYRASWKTS